MADPKRCPSQMEPIEHAFVLVHSMIARDALHRKGFRLADLSAQDIAAHLANEARELAEQPSDISEAGDLLGAFVHLAIRNEWTMKEIVDAMIAKFSERFTYPPRGEPK